MSTGLLRLVPAAPANRPLAVRISDFTFKKGESPDELAQIHALNYRTFVREIGQHADPGVPALVDKFHDKNLYLVAKRGPDVVAMLAVHDRPPFSVATRMPDPSWITAHCPWPLEVRLLAVQPDERHTVALPGLLWCLHRLARAAGYTHLLASGVRQQLRLYRRLGFAPLGPERLAGNAWFTPLALDLKRMPAAAGRIAARLERLAGLEPLFTARRRISMLPGPVQVSPFVRRALHRPLVSHRDSRLITRFERVRRVLSDMTGGVSVGLQVGSGTLANECIAATLASLQPIRRGLILSNGEFGRRLIEQGRRWRVEFETLEWPWGRAWRMDEVDDALSRLGPGAWVWGVHCESSTGMLNPLEKLVEAAARRRARVCVDCISSLGSVPLDLNGVFLASGASGKCLGAIAGVAILFGDANALRACPRAPTASYLDALELFESNGPRFTFASTLIDALRAALSRYATPLARERAYAAYRVLGATVRQALLRLGTTPLADGGAASPALTTFVPPLGYSPEHFALLCRAYGFEINAKSSYLIERGLAQIATMGDVQTSDCERLFRALDRWSRSAG